MLPEVGEIFDCCLKGGVVGIDRSNHGLVSQHDVAHQLIGIDGNGITWCRDTGKDVDTIDSKDTQYVEGYRGDANGLVDQVDGTDQTGQILECHIIRGDVIRSDGLYDLGLGVGERGAVVDIGFKAGSLHGHGSENPDRPGSENDGI